MARHLTYAQAIREATDQCMANDDRVYVMGEGVPDPKGIFGTTLGLREQYGPERVMEMPVSEDGMTGVAIGSAITGLRPIMTHQRMDFALLAMNQIVNSAAKWHYMFGGQASVPLVIRMVIGMGWGQGAQHSQSLQAWFAHVPGLKVVMPVTPYDAKGLLVAAVEDDDPVIFIEHRWLHNISGEVPEGMYRVPIGKGRIARPGKDVTIAATSYMVLESLRAAEMLAHAGVEAEVLDARTIKPLDQELVTSSVRKTGRLVVADTGWKTGGFGGEIVAVAVESAFGALRAAPRRIGLPDSPTPTAEALSRYYYPRAADIAAAAAETLGLAATDVVPSSPDGSAPSDVPDSTFTGPF